MLKNKHIIIGITGGIAAYKVPLIIRSLVKEKAEVRVVMTEHAKYFVAPLTLSTLSGSPVVSGTFPTGLYENSYSGTWHVKLAQWADAMLIAPATANVIAKLAGGIADDAVTTLALALRGLLVIAPAMDYDMWKNSITQENIEKLHQRGVHIIAPTIGELASGLVGTGRMAEPKAIINYLDKIFNKQKNDFIGVKFLITAGPTREPIDPIRYISNHSSGKMGFALATSASQRGAQVTLITGPVHLQTPKNVQRIDIQTAEEMYNAVLRHSKNADVVIMAAAVADFTPSIYTQQKIKKTDINTPSFLLELSKTKDILQALSLKKNKKILVGFALETKNELTYAKKKLREKNLDLIVVNNPLVAGAGFGTDTNKVSIVLKSGKTINLKKMSKIEVAGEILDQISILLKSKS